MKPRPTRKDLIDEVITQLESEVSDWLNDVSWDDISIDIKDALDSCHSWDGYELAKYLEDRRGYCGVDSDLVDILNGADRHYYSGLRKLVQKWVIDEKITNKLNLDDKVEVSIHGEKEYGCIKFVDSVVAEYKVHIAGDDALGTRLYIFPYEVLEKQNEADSETVLPSTGETTGAQ